MKRWFKLKSLALWRWLFVYKFRHVDPGVCCCGCTLGEGGSICHHGGCRSAKEHAVTSALESKRKQYAG